MGSYELAQQSIRQSTLLRSVCVAKGRWIDLVLRPIIVPMLHTNGMTAYAFAIFQLARTTEATFNTHVHALVA